VLTFPNAKINIGLLIKGKRPDGYHNLESIFYPVPSCDALELIPANKFSFETEGLEIGTNESNLCVKAYRLMEKEYGIPPVEMFLLKKIPVFSGLGGGSSDGTFTLKLLNEVFKLNLKPEKLEELAAQLGSDCPFFVHNKPAFVSGRGEEIQEIDFSLKGYYLAIIAPGIPISTAEAFSNLSGSLEADRLINLKESVKKPIGEWQDFICNDFEEYAFSRHPEIRKIKEHLLEAGALFASMTGSGSAVYGISRGKLKLNYEPAWEGELKV
jgi:4-diphosphocytidyl-2-C-methyl-D-erythritol kinase